MFGIRHNAALLNAKGSATAAGTAVAELLNSQLCTIQFVSFLGGACILIYFFGDNSFDMIRLYDR